MGFHIQNSDQKLNSECQKRCLDIYLSVHISQIKDMQKQVRDAWETGCIIHSKRCELARLGSIQTKSNIPKGEQMPQTVGAWQQWGDRVEKKMLADKAEIANLKQTINQLRQSNRLS